MILKNEGGNGDIHLQIHKAEEGFGKTEKIIWEVQNIRRIYGSWKRKSLEVRKG